MPDKERVRLTISIDPEVLEVFRTMAKAGSMSVGRCIGDWCGDTVDGAQFVAAKMVEAKKAPARVMREMQAMAGGLLEEVKKESVALSAKRRAASVQGRRGG